MTATKFTEEKALGFQMIIEKVNDSTMLFSGVKKDQINKLASMFGGWSKQEESGDYKLISTDSNEICKYLEDSKKLYGRLVI